MQQMIECSELGVIRDIPVELEQLQEQNVSLNQSNKILKIALLLIAVGAVTYIIYETIQNERKEKQK